MIGDLFLHKMALGLKNIIVLHVPVTGVTVNAMLTAGQESKYAWLKNLYGFACMDNLLMAHSDHPVSYAPDESADVSVILHTSGSTTGTGKPVPLSDRAFNAAAAAFYKMDELELDWDSLVTAVIVDLSNAYSMIDQVHVPFALGAAVIVVPGGVLNPWFYKAIPKYKISFLFTISAMFEHWINMHDPNELDFSSLRTVVLGGTSVSASDKQRYYGFMRQHGAGDVALLNGYGISELGGACYLSTRDMSDESIGYPLPGVQTRLLDEETWREMLEKERITDLIITDIMVSPAFLEELASLKEKLGLRRVILIHSRMGGPAIGPAELVYNEYNYHMLKARPDTLFMEDLLERYKDTEICFDRSEGDSIAFIVHTSGTTKGTRKPLPFTDKVFNDALNLIPRGLHSFLEGADDGSPLRVVQLFDFSSIMALSGQTCVAFAHADTLILTYFGFMHPKFIRAVDYYNVNFLHITGFMVDKWLKRSDLDSIDLSSLKVIGISGGYVSPEKMDQYRSFFKAYGYRYDITAGYGMSETGKPMFAPKGNREDILGYETDPESVRIRDENDGKFYRLSDGPRTGILYKASDTGCENVLDGVTLFEYTKIDGWDYLCTNDLVRVNADSSISFAGRADNYYANNEGKRFDAGIVERNLSAHSAVRACAVVPIMDKRIHDTVPVLYVVPAEVGSHAAEAIHGAFLDVYVRDRRIEAENLPTQFMLVEDIPLNANGKPDVFRITRERIGGDAYNLIPVMDGGALSDIRIEHVEHVNSMTAGTLPSGMENHSAYDIFDLFTASPVSDPSADISSWNPLKPWELFMKGKAPKEKPSEKTKIPDPVWKIMLKYGNRVVGVPSGRKHINHDFED